MTYQLKCNRRGYHQIGPLVVETGDLFGLHRRYRVLTSPHFLLVYPMSCRWKATSWPHGGRSAKSTSPTASTKTRRESPASAATNWAIP